jgi:hypothetical protein
VQLYHYFVSQSSKFCHHNPFCYFSISNTKGKCIFHYRVSLETFGYTLFQFKFPKVDKNLFWSLKIIWIFNCLHIEGFVSNGFCDFMSICQSEMCYACCLKGCISTYNMNKDWISADLSILFSVGEWWLFFSTKKWSFLYTVMLDTKLLMYIQMSHTRH